MAIYFPDSRLRGNDRGKFLAKGGGCTYPIIPDDGEGQAGTPVPTKGYEWQVVSGESGQEEDEGGHTFQLLLKVFRRKTQGYKTVPAGQRDCYLFSGFPPTRE
jgi:hypothetical protein